MNKKTMTMTLSVVLGVTIIGLIAGIAILAITTSNYRTQLENVYTRSFYEVSSNINDLEVDISKLIVVTTPEVKQLVLTDIYSLCQVTNTNISNLPVSSRNIGEITDFVNRMGGFSYSLIEKVDRGQEWTEEDYKSISDLHTYSLNLMYEFNNHVNSLKFDYSMLSQIDYKNEGKSSLNDTFLNIQGSNSGVPTLIYDGPFADSTIKTDIKGLPETEVTQEQAREMLESNLSNVYTIKSIEFVSETTGLFATYNYRVKSEDLTLYVQVTKRGGIIIDITSMGKVGNKNLSAGECDGLASTFAKNLGLFDMYPVWSAISGATAYVNLAPIVNGVIYYSDLIKVKIDKTTGQVTGWEAKNYYANHTERTLSTPQISLNDAQSKLSPILQVKERNKAVIPLDFDDEYYAYEFVCTWKDYEYYIYIDVVTGKEINILRLVKTSAGNLIVLVLIRLD